MTVISFVLFFVAGLGFGYAIASAWRFLPLIFPLLLAAGAFLRDGISAGSLAKLVIAIVVTLIGIALGTMLDQRSARRQAAGAS